jgi:hypothetical protein
MKQAALLLTAICLCCNLNTNAQAPRVETLFDENWKFLKGDLTGAEQSNFNDKAWRNKALAQPLPVTLLVAQDGTEKLLLLNPARHTVKQF